MNKTVKSEFIDKNLLAKNPDLLKEILEAQRIELFKDLSIVDDQPIVLTFKSINTADLGRDFSDPLGHVKVMTTINVEYPVVRDVVINKLVTEKYTEHKSFWQKLKLLFSKKPIYTKETKGI